MDKEKNIEFEGYKVVADRLSRIGAKFLKWSDKVNFEMFKMQFGEREDDIYIATYPKSGTTLLQMILYQLTTDGKMNFKHIYEVSPWLRNACFKGEKVPELPSPRIVKTHDDYKDFDKKVKGKFIYAYRNGMDVSVSLFHQNRNYNNSNLTFELFWNKNLKTKLWFKHCKFWFENKNKLDILYVRYEDLIGDKRREIDRIIKFCNLKPTEDQIERAMKYSSFEFMKENEVLFGDQPVERNKIYDQFIRKGQSGEGDELFTAQQKDEFKSLYESMVKPYEEQVFNKA